MDDLKHIATSTISNTLEISSTASDISCISNDFNNIIQLAIGISINNNSRETCYHSIGEHELMATIVIIQEQVEKYYTKIVSITESDPQFQVETTNYNSLLNVSKLLHNLLQSVHIYKASNEYQTSLPIYSDIHGSNCHLIPLQWETISVGSNSSNLPNLVNPPTFKDFINWKIRNPIHCKHGTKCNGFKKRNMENYCPMIHSSEDCLAGRYCRTGSCQLVHPSGGKPCTSKNNCKLQLACVYSHTQKDITKWYSNQESRTWCELISKKSINDYPL